MYGASRMPPSLNRAMEVLAESLMYIVIVIVVL